MLAVRRIRADIEDSGCQGNIFPLANQLWWYQETFGCLPPPFISDQSGKPLYSWRVVLLPITRGDPISEEFDYTKPWDDPVNLQIANGGNGWRLKNLSCPSIKHEKIGQTNYFYALRANDHWPRDFFIDPHLRPKILLVESQWRDVHWSEPVDFVYEKSGEGFLKKLRESEPPHPGGFNCVTSDCAPIKVPGSVMHHTDRLTLTFFPRPRKLDDRAEKEQVDALVDKLIKALNDPGNSVNNLRRVALLYLGELGPRAAAAVPGIRRVMAEGDQSLAGIVALTLAKIEK